MTRYLFSGLFLLCFCLDSFSQIERPSVEKGDHFITIRKVRYTRDKDRLIEGRIIGLELGFAYCFADNWVAIGSLYSEQMKQNLEGVGNPWWHGPEWSSEIRPALFLRRYLFRSPGSKLNFYANGGVEARFYEAQRHPDPWQYPAEIRSYTGELSLGMNWRLSPRWSVEGDAGARYRFAAWGFKYVADTLPWGIASNLSLNFHLFPPA